MDINIQNNLIAPLINANNELSENIRLTMEKVVDSARLVNLSMQNPGDAVQTDVYDFSGNYEDFLKEQKQKIDQHAATIRDIVKNFNQVANKQMKIVADELNTYRMIKSLDDSSQFISVQSKISGRQKFRKQYDKLTGYFQRIQAGLWHSQSSAQLLAKKITASADASSSTISNILNLKELVSPEKKVLSKLPFYYQQLFASKYNYQNDFWFGRQKEVQEARKTFLRHRAGFQGILIITGAWRSGKSFFANYIAGKLFSEDTIYNIAPPPAGTTDPEVLDNTFREACNMQGTAIDILNAAPDRSTFIFDDMELWWEKAENGTGLLNVLYEMLKEFSFKHFFILTFNVTTFPVISKQVPFDQLALHTIGLKPFNSKELEDIILFRHRTSGFDLQVNRTMPAGLTLVLQARLFSKIFRLSDGNIGSALLSWIASVKDFEKNTVIIQTPPVVDSLIFENIDLNGKINLLMFILHKRLTVEKLCRITREPEEKVMQEINFLKRCGLLNEIAGQIYELDPYLYSHVKKFIFETFDNISD